MFYIVWGEANEKLLERSTASLRKYHPELPVHVECLSSDLGPWDGLLQKSRMFQLSPFKTTLFLDADTIVLGKLDFGFEMSERHGLACCICECPWARRHIGLKSHDDLVEYNTGVLFFTEKAKPIFDGWERLAPTLDSSSVFLNDDRRVRKQPHDDQASFALALHESAISPFVLPLNWNFRPNFFRSFFGPIKIWHHPQEPGRIVQEITDYYRHADSIIQYVEDPRHWVKQD